MRRDSDKTDAWARFVAGDDVDGSEVRPEILASWFRCRDDYNVDPWRERAPDAPEGESRHALTDDVVLVELGGIARSIAAEAERLGGLAAVADGRGTVLAAWGDREALNDASERNLARWATWSESDSGTNGLGTALERSTATIVARSEHWCAGFHEWTCAGIAIRDPITSDPLGVLDVSLFRRSAPITMSVWLERLVAPIEAELQQQATRSHSELLDAFATRERSARGPLIAADNSGRFLAANEQGLLVLGVPESAVGTPGAIHQAGHDSLALKDAVLQAVQRAMANRSWFGSVELSLTALETESRLSLRPVIVDDVVVGVLISGPGLPGERLGADPPAPGPNLNRVLGIRAQRLVVLAPEEIRFAEADGNTVWMTTDRGRLRAFGRGLRALEDRVAGHGFLRVSRQSLVNLNRVREIAPSFKGGFALAMDGSPDEVIPVSRRHAAEVRRILGLG